MKKITLLIITLMLAVPDFTSQAQQNYYSPVPKTKYDFLNLAGPENDTLTALVNMFYRKRKEGATGLKIVGASIPLVFLLTTGVVIGSGLKPNSKDPEKKVQNIGIGFSVVFYGVGIPSSYRLIKYNRKKLHNIILEYPQQQHIPSTYLRNIRQRDFNPD